EKRAEVRELLVAARLPEPDRVHRRVVLDHRQRESRVLDLLLVEGERRVVPREIGARFAPVEEAPREHADGLVDADLPEHLPEGVGRRLEQDLGDPDHRQFVSPGGGPGRARRPMSRGYLGGNCELAAGGARFARGGLSRKPITAQFTSTPADPYGAGLPVFGSTPVRRSGRRAARSKTTFSSIWRLFSPCMTAFGVQRPSCASQSGLYASAWRGLARVGKSPNTLSRSPPFRSASMNASLSALASSAAWPSLTRWTNPCASSFPSPVSPLTNPNRRSRAEPRKSSPPLYGALFRAGTYVARSSTAVSGCPASVLR